MDWRWLEALSWSRYQITLLAQEPVSLPALPGVSLWRALVAALRRVTCSTRLPECAGCPLFQTCAFPVLAGAPTGARPVRPPAVVLQPTPGPVELQPGDPYSFGVVLLGPAADSLPLLALALEAMACRGLGTKERRGRCRLHAITALGSGGHRPVYDPFHRSLLAAGAPASGKDVLAQAATLAARRAHGAPLELRLLSPLRLRRAAARLCVEPAALVGELVARLWGLVRAQDPQRAGSGAAPDVRALVSHAAHLTADGALLWQPWDRPTGRAGLWTDQGGLVGTLVLHGPVEPLLPALLAGEIAHVGLYTQFGFGQYRVVG